MQYFFLCLLVLIVIVIVQGYKNKKHNDEIKRIENSLNKSFSGFYSAYKALAQEYISHSKEIEFTNVWKTLFEQVKAIKVLPKDSIFQAVQKFLNDYQSLHNYVLNSNEAFITNEKIKQDNLLSNIDGKSLDEQQRTVVVTDEDHNLIIAGAGSGKTLTIAGKVKYLCEVKNINPEDILLIAFTKKSAEEMSERIAGRLQIPINATTFHKLGLDIIKTTSNTSPDIYDKLPQFVKEYFEKELADNPDVIKSLIQYFAYYLQVPPNMDEFNSIGAAFEYERTADLETLKSKYDMADAVKETAAAKKEIKETLQGEHVKSLEEVMISNFLFLNGIEYEYEKLYPIRSENAEYTAYRPDFYLPQYDIYIEHFGINKENRLPWLSPVEESKYLDGMTWKRNFHKENGTKLLETYSYYTSEGRLLEELQSILENNGVKFIEPDFKDIFNKIYGDASDKYLEEFMKLCCTFITLFKSNNYTVENLWSLDYDDGKKNNIYHIQRRKLFFEIIETIISNYDKFLQETNAVDFADMINKATRCVEGGCKIRQYKYVIIDEFQDISVARYRLVKAILDKTGAKLLCVGDDWQSIYRFTGSDISLFTNFEQYFGYTCTMKIEQTYRNSQQLIDEVGKFIIKNPKQIHKSLKSGKTITYPLTFLFYDKDPFFQLRRAIDKTIADFGAEASILLLGRTNYDFELIKQSKMFNIKGEKITYLESSETPISFLTVHKSKGLEADNVILVNFRNALIGFPNKMSNDVLLELVLHESDSIIYAEERRLLYVALTRTRNRVFILTSATMPSEFVHEFKENENVCYANQSSKNDEPVVDCPYCKTGHLMIRQNEKTDKYFVGCSNYPSCTYTVNDVTVLRNNKKCPRCGGFMTKRKGTYGEFWGCTNYPYCNFTENI